MTKPDSTPVSEEMKRAAASMCECPKCGWMHPKSVAQTLTRDKSQQNDLPLPCRFCRSSDVFVYECEEVDAGCSTFWVECEGCSARGSISEYKAGALQYWNGNRAVNARQFVQNYRFEFDGGGEHAPTDHEKAMLEDAIEEYVSTNAQQVAPPAPCTCHPDDNPPRPCPQKFAHSECVAAAISGISTGDLFNALLGRINFDGADPRTFSLSELHGAIKGARWPE